MARTPEFKIKTVGGKPCPNNTISRAYADVPEEDVPETPDMSQFSTGGEIAPAPEAADVAEEAAPDAEDE
jgi:hypothetical protein